MATFASPRGLALPLRPEKGQQVECNAPLSASTVRVDKSVSPAFEGLDAHAAGAREAARREQLRAFQAGLLGRLERLEKAKREEARARAAQLVLAQDVERGRARQLAAHASADLVRALRVAPGARPPGRPAREGRAPEAEAWPEGKLYAQARQTLGAVLDARAGLRARTAAARAEVGVRADEGEGEGSEAEEDEEGEEAAEARFGSVAEGAAGGGAAPESARARARERLGAVASLACPSACSLGGGAPLASASLAGTTAPEASALRAAARASQRHAGGGRSAEALLLFDSARRESLSAERAYVQLVQAQRTAQQQAARAAEKAARRREEAAREEARSAAAREHLATAAEAEAAKLREGRVSRAARRSRQTTQAARYSEALRASLKAKLEALRLPQPLPALCACGLHPLDDHVSLCAHNCELRHNPRAYALALSRMLVANGAGHLLDVHTALLPPPQPPHRPAASPTAERARSPARVGARSSPGF